MFDWLALWLQISAVHLAGNEVSRHLNTYIKEVELSSLRATDNLKITNF
jgi:hypothetical protein